MPVHLEMRYDGRLAYWEISDPWTLEELIKLLPEAQHQFTRTDAFVYSFIDARHARRFPQGIFQLPKLAIWDLPNGREVFFVTSSVAARSMLQLLFRLARSDRLVVYTDYDEAWNSIQQLLASTAKTGKFKLDMFNDKAR